jgi:salicylate hydroxylase
MTKTPAASVLIVGGGLGGCALGLSLLQRGFQVQIHEQAKVLTEHGAGLTLPPSALRALAGLGLFEQVCAASVGQVGGTHRHYRTGDILSGVPDNDWQKRPTTTEQTAHCRRAGLHRILVDAIAALDPEAFRLGSRLNSLRQDEKGVDAKFEDGRSARGDILVGADGLRSVVHDLLFGARPPRLTGVVALRTLVPRSDIEPFVSGGRFINWVGPERGFLRYGVDQGRLVNCVALARTNRWQAEGWLNASSREELLSLYGDFHPDVLGIINHAPKDGIFKWALYDRDPVPVWSEGRVTLLGDAAHPMLPFLGQGATTALEDGVVLARCLDAFPDIPEAFAAYERARKPRTTSLMLASRAQGEALYQDNPYAYEKTRVDMTPYRSYDPHAASISAA